jgi:hypothetical protein
MENENDGYDVLVSELKVTEPDEFVIVRHDQLKVFQLSFRLASEIFYLSRSFPPEERFSLTDQIRKSSRSVIAKLVVMINNPDPWLLEGKK